MSQRVSTPTATATAPTVPASVGRRLGGWLVDGLLIGLVFAAATSLQLAGALGGSLVLVVAGTAGALLYPLVLVWLQGSRGFTPGKLAVGTRTVDAATGKPIGFGRALLRQIVLGVLGPFNLIQILTLPRHPRRQGWHDRAAGSVVVSALSTATASPAVSAQRDDAKSFVPRPGPRPATPWPTASVPDLASPAAGPPVPASGTAPASTVEPGPRMVAPPPMGSPPHSAVGADVPAAPAPRGPVPPPPVSPAPVAAPYTADRTTLAPAPAPAGPAPAPAPVADPSRLASPAPPAFTQITGPPQPAHPAGPAPVSAPPGASWLLATPSEHKVLAGPVLVGRDPDRDLAPDAEVWAIDDPELSVSKTHALFGVDATGAWVEDWHSTNGVELRRHAESVPLAPHTRTYLAEGDSVALGDVLVVVAKEQS